MFLLSWKNRNGANGQTSGAMWAMLDYMTANSCIHPLKEKEQEKNERERTYLSLVKDLNTALTSRAAVDVFLDYRMKQLQGIIDIAYSYVLILCCYNKISKAGKINKKQEFI